MVAALVIAGGWALASVLAMGIGTKLSWPDYVHENFGVPLTFATHTLSTFAGPADKWDYDVGALAADLLFWLGGMAIVLVAFVYFRRRSAVSVQGGTGLTSPTGGLTAKRATRTSQVILLLSLCIGVGIALFTGLLDVTPGGIVGARWFGYPLPWLYRVVVAPQYFPWRMDWSNLVLDAILWCAVGALASLLATWALGRAALGRRVETKSGPLNKEVGPPLSSR